MRNLLALALATWPALASAQTAECNKIKVSSSPLQITISPPPPNNNKSIVVQIFRKKDVAKVYMGSPDVDQKIANSVAIYSRGLLQSSSIVTPVLSMTTKRVFDHDLGEDVISEHGNFVLAGNTTFASHRGADNRQEAYHFDLSYTFEKEDMVSLGGCNFKRVSYSVAAKDSRSPGKVTKITAEYLPELGIPWDVLKPTLALPGATISLQTEFSPLATK